MVGIPNEADDELLARIVRHISGIGPMDAPEILRQKLNAEFLPYVDARELHRRISAFRKLNFRVMSYAEVSDAIRNVIMFDTPKGYRGMLQPVNSQYPAGTKFYRVRVIPKDDHITPLRSMSKVADCWEPPPEVVKMGRLNKEHEPLLYTSPVDPLVAIDEIKIPDGERFSLIVYEAVEEVNVTVVGGDVDTEGLADADALKVEMIQGFLRDEFTRDVGQGTEHLYQISEIIAKHYFDLPPVVHDAWCYPSIVDKSKFNVVFRPNTRTKLRLVGVQIGELQRTENGEPVMCVLLVATEVEGCDDLAYFHIGSPEQREFFPWITSNKTVSVQDG